MNAFHWQAQPSRIAPELPGYKPAKTLAPKRLHVYQAAKVDQNRELEAQIEQTNREVEQHFVLAQSNVAEGLRVFHRDEARRLAAKVKALVALRSPEYVDRLEAERGLA